MRARGSGPEGSDDPTLVLVWEAPEGTRFAQLRGERVKWVSEYPDATIFDTSREAFAARRVAWLVDSMRTINVVENYGLENERRM